MTTNIFTQTLLKKSQTKRVKVQVTQATNTRYTSYKYTLHKLKHTLTQILLGLRSLTMYRYNSKQYEQGVRTERNHRPFS